MVKTKFSIPLAIVLRLFLLVFIVACTEEELSMVPSASKNPITRYDTSRKDPFYYTAKINIPGPDTAVFNEIYKLELFDRFVEKPMPVKVWAEKVVYHGFSSTTSFDKFVLRVIGDKYYNAMIYFTIYNHAETQIYIDSFLMVDALAKGIEGGGHYSTHSERERFLSHYIHEFIDFAKIKPREKLQASIESFNPAFVIHPNLENLLMDSTPYYFVYEKKPNSETYIAFANGEQKTLKIYEY